MAGRTTTGDGISDEIAYDPRVHAPFTEQDLRDLIGPASDGGQRLPTDWEYEIMRRVLQQAPALLARARRIEAAGALAGAAELIAAASEGYEISRLPEGWRDRAKVWLEDVAPLIHTGAAGSYGEQAATVTVNLIGDLLKESAYGSLPGLWPSRAAVWHDRYRPVLESVLAENYTAEAEPDAPGL